MSHVLEFCLKEKEVESIQHQIESEPKEFSGRGRLGNCCDAPLFQACVFVWEYKLQSKDIRHVTAQWQVMTLCSDSPNCLDWKNSAAFSAYLCLSSNMKKDNSSNSPSWFTFSGFQKEVCKALVVLLSSLNWHLLVMCFKYFCFATIRWLRANPA